MEPVIETTTEIVAEASGNALTTFTKSKAGIITMSATGLIVLVLIGLWVYKRFIKKNDAEQQNEETTGWFGRLFGKK